MSKPVLHIPADLKNFFVAGVNYKKTDVALRGLFAVSQSGYEQILDSAYLFGSDSLFVLSTCNRTEIYGFAEGAAQLINLLCTQTRGDQEAFTALAYVKEGVEAVEHLFNVGAGLDSQILGDYEIVGQLKKAVNFSREKGFINCFTERLVNTVLQASKNIKKETDLSGGTVSVSFAAMQYIREHTADIKDKQILVIGTGKIGRNTCQNLVDYLKTTNITLINRTDEKAAGLAADLNLRFAPAVELAERIEQADIILVASNAPEPVVLAQHLLNSGNKLILDLSIPCNVEANVVNLPNITLINVDQLSALKDETLTRREAEAPKAKRIVGEYLLTFMDWHDMRRNAAVLKEIKIKLNDIHQREEIVYTDTRPKCPLRNLDEKIQSVIKGAAHKMRVQNQWGCHYLEAINEFIGASIN